MEYVCPICGKSVTTPFSLKCHMRIHSGDKPFECRICRKRFTTSIALRTHSSVHSGNKPFKCGTCEKSFRLKHQLTEHLQCHSGKSFKCDDCGKVLKNDRSLRHHKKRHTTGNPFYCSLCKKDFGSERYLKIHCDNIHSGLKPHKCDACGVSFGLRSSLSRHISLLHKTARKFHCEFCERGFLDRTSLKHHLYIHQGLKPQKCDVCGKGFVTVSELNIHKKIHSERQKCHCHVCGKTYTDERCLKAHIRLYHTITPDESTNATKTYTCEQCGKMFKFKSQLTRHLNIHGEKKHKCNQCGKTFADFFYFKRHARVHTDEKPFSCDICNKAFRDKRHLDVHRVIHSDEKPFLCALCGKGFKLKRHLSLHHVITHSKERPNQCTKCGKRYKRKQDLKRHKCSAAHVETAGAFGGNMQGNAKVQNMANNPQYMGRFTSNVDTTENSSFLEHLSTTEIPFAVRQSLETHPESQLGRQYFEKYPGVENEPGEHYPYMSRIQMYNQPESGNQGIYSSANQQISEFHQHNDMRQLHLPEYFQSKPYPAGAEFFRGTEERNSTEFNMKQYETTELRIEATMSLRPESQLSAQFASITEKSTNIEHLVAYNSESMADIANPLTCISEGPETVIPGPDSKVDSESAAHEKQSNHLHTVRGIQASLPTNLNHEIKTSVPESVMQQSPISTEEGKMGDVFLDRSQEHNERQVSEPPPVQRPCENPINTDIPEKTFTCKSTETTPLDNTLEQEILANPKAMDNDNQQDKNQNPAENKDEKTDQCKQCDRTFTTLHCLAGHNETHREMKKYKCSECNKTFYSEEEMKDHARSHIGGQFGCSFCGESFNDTRYLSKHIRVEHSEKTVSRRKQKGGKSNKAVRKLSLPPKIRAGRTVKRKQSCTVSDSVNEPHESCDIANGPAFNASQPFQQRAKTKAELKVYQVCPNDSSLEAEQQMSGEVSDEESIDSEAVEPAASYSDQQSDQKLLKESLTQKSRKRRARSKNKHAKFTCNECGKDFNRRYDFGRHMETHEVSFRYCCEICGAKLQTRERTTIHLHNHIENDTVCPQCEASFHNLTNLQKHIMSHTKHDGKPLLTTEIQAKDNRRNTRPKRNQTNNPDKTTQPEIYSSEGEDDSVLPSTQSSRFKCKTCSKSFEYKYQLSKHEQTHSKMQHYYCEICNKYFKHQKSGLYHVRRHVDGNSCSHCKVAFEEPKELSKHMSNYLKFDEEGKEGIERTDTGKTTKRGKAYSCDKCSAEFTRETFYDNHMFKEHGIRNHKCSMCASMYGTRSNLTAHIQTHGEFRFRCDLCQKGFHSAFKLNAHKRLHTGERPFVCKVCNFACRTKFGLQEHQTRHTEEKRFICDVCNRAFAYSSGLRAHKRVHSDVRKHVCDVCGSSFKTLSYLKIHKYTHMDKTARPRPYVCNLCGKTFAASWDLKVHEKKHKGELNYQCETCGKKFVTACHLKAHERVHRERENNYICEECGKGFKENSYLQEHIRRHTDTSSRRYSCDGCSKTFMYPNELKKHRRTHTGEKPFVCEMCGEAFRDKGVLATHVLQHSGIQQFCCNICNKSFNRKIYLTLHNRIHTGQKTIQLFIL